MDLTHFPLTQLKGVGPKLAERLLKLGLSTVQDVLFHLPLRYEDRTRVHAIADLQPFTHCTVVACIEQTEISQGKRRMLNCMVNDGSGRLTLRFFNFSAAQKNQLAAGKTIQVFAEVKRGKFGFEMIHPEYKLVAPDAPIEAEETLTPIYPSTEGLRQASWRQLTDQAIALLQRYPLSDILPTAYWPFGWSVNQALMFIHRPPPDADLFLLEQATHPAQQRLIIEELIAHQFSMFAFRHQEQQARAIAMQIEPSLEQQFLAQPYHRSSCV